MALILEGLVTSLNADRTVHLTPMGPVFESPDAMQFELRPYEGSTTLANLQRHPQGVLHVTDDVSLIAVAALGQLTTLPAMKPAQSIDGSILADACRWYEFEVDQHTANPPRHRLLCRVVAYGRGRDFWGFNRARHALLEAAILLTRVGLLEPEYIRREFERLAVPIEKTAGEAEQQLFERLKAELELRTTRQGLQ